MSQIFALVALLICFVPAVVSLAFASRRLPFMLWNLSWYWIMGLLGAHVTQSPAGSLVGLFFAVFHILRVITRPERTEPRFVFKNFSTVFGNQGFGKQGPGGFSDAFSKGGFGGGFRDPSHKPQNAHSAPSSGPHPFGASNTPQSAQDEVIEAEFRHAEEGKNPKLLP